MASQLEQMLQDTLGDIEHCSPEKIQALLQEAMKTFTVLQQKGGSEDPKEREEALQMANSLKVAIQAQAEDFSKKAGIDPAEFAALAASQSAFSPEMLEQLNAAKEELKMFQEDAEVVQAKKPTHHTKKNKAAWIPG